jgi:hypothetical protein
MRCTLLGCVARGCPKKAFALFEQASFTTVKYLHFGASCIGSSSKTGDERNALLSAMRTKLPLMRDPELRAILHEGVLEGLGSNLGGLFDDDGASEESDHRWNFEAAMRWLQSADLDEEERRLVTTSFGRPADLSEIDRWLDWIVAQQSSGWTERHRIFLPEWWAQSDPAAARDWLSKVGPEESAYEAVVSGIARGAAFHSLELGQEIARLLPHGPLSDRLATSLTQCFEAGEAWRTQDRG